MKKKCLYDVICIESAFLQKEYFPSKCFIFPIITLKHGNSAESLGCWAHLKMDSQSVASLAPILPFIHCTALSQEAVIIVLLAARLGIRSALSPQFDPLLYSGSERSRET